MKRSIGLLLAVASCWLLCAPVSATSKLNSSKSNINRLIYPDGLLDQGQVKSLLAALDALGQVDEAKAKAWLVANFKNYGIAEGVVQKIVVLPSPGERVNRPEFGAATTARTIASPNLSNASRKEMTIILLTTADPADEKAAVSFANAVTVKGSKSNSDN